MRRLLLQAKRSDPRVRDCASDLVKDIPGKNWRQEIDAIFYYVRDFIRYQLDPVEIETVQSPWETLSRGYGDCDDQALLVASLLETIGHPTRFMAIGLKPRTLIHVYAQAKCGNDWISLDTTEMHNPGWEPPGIVNRLVIYNGS